MLMRPLVELLTPSRCLGCGKSGRVACGECISARIIRKTPSCPGCNTLTREGRVCGRCRHGWSCSGVSVAARYDQLVRELVLGLKHQGDRELARVLAGLMVPSLPQAQFDLVTSVPSPPGRRRVRGHSPSQMIAREVALSLGLPYQELAIRLGNSRQVGQGRSERFRQVEGAFLPLPKAGSVSRVLIVDDVLTTGATLNELARTLKGAGVKRVWGAVPARR